MEFFGFAITLLAAILTYQSWKNGRWMKQAHKETQDLIREMRKETDETLRGINETLRGINETLRGINETMREMARLIVTDGEKTRNLIRETSSP